MAKYNFEILGKIVEVQANAGNILIDSKIIATYYKDEGSSYRVKLVGNTYSEDDAQYSVQHCASYAALMHFSRLASKTAKPEPIAPVEPAPVAPVEPICYGKPYIVNSTFTGVKRDTWAAFASFYPASVSACDTYNDGTTRHRSGGMVIASLYGDGYTYLVGDVSREDDDIADCENGNGFNPYFADLDEALAQAVAACEKDFKDNFWRWSE